jgi:hypothetical protein
LIFVVFKVQLTHAHAYAKIMTCVSPICSAPKENLPNI